jgi:hypothetical protein
VAWIVRYEGTPITRPGEPIPVWVNISPTVSLPPTWEEAVVIGWTTGRIVQVRHSDGREHWYAAARVRRKGPPGAR